MPLMQAPVGPAGTPELVAAVSGAGAVGTLAASWTDPSVLRGQIQRIAAATDRPYCVNLVLAFDQRERLRVVIKEAVPLVSFSWGVDDAMIRLARDSGMTVLIQVGNIEDAIRADAAGADLLIAQGLEAGGHVQSTTPLEPLIRAVRRVVRRPIVAAGGIADADGARRAIGAGADAIACGTAFLAASEADVHPHYLDRLIRADPDDTVVTELFDGGWPDAPHRVLRNSTVARWEAEGRPGPGARPGEGDVVAHRNGQPVARYDDTQPTRSTSGDIEAMAMYAGQSVVGITRREPAAAIVQRIAGSLRHGHSR